MADGGEGGLGDGEGKGAVFYTAPFQFLHDPLSDSDVQNVGEPPSLPTTSPLYNTLQTLSYLHPTRSYPEISRTLVIITILKGRFYV